VKRLVGLAVSCAACSDPGYTCDQNRAHITVDGTCAFDPVAITIDGDFTDWDALELYPPDCPDCAAGAVSGVYATETTNGEIAVYLTTVGPPLTDLGHAYYAGFTPRVFPPYQYGVRARPSKSEVVMSYTIVVGGVPARAAFGATGVELAIPISALPFTAGIDIFGELNRDDFGWGDAQDIPYPYATVCWDPTSPLCRPWLAPQL
jgi:hypothetical protein